MIEKTTFLLRGSLALKLRKTSPEMTVGVPRLTWRKPGSVIPTPSYFCSPEQTRFKTAFAHLAGSWVPGSKLMQTFLSRNCKFRQSESPLKSCLSNISFSSHQWSQGLRSIKKYIFQTWKDQWFLKLACLSLKLNSSPKVFFSLVVF